MTDEPILAGLDPGRRRRDGLDSGVVQVAAIDPELGLAAAGDDQGQVCHQNPFPPPPCRLSPTMMTMGTMMIAMRDMMTMRIGPRSCRFAVWM